MRHLILLVIGLVASALAGPRVRRQTGTGNWWENIDIATGSEDKDTVDVFAEIPATPGDSGPAPLTNLNNQSVVDLGNTVDTRSLECDGPGTVCVPYYQCNNGTVITDGATLIDIRTSGKCERFLDVCCKGPRTDTRPTPGPYVASCGHLNDNGVHAQLSGLNVSQTQFGEYPWMAAILRVEKIGEEEVNLYLCGGSLIGPNLILTAAHCVSNYEAKYLKVRAGEWDTQNTYEVYPHQDKIVEKVIVHPEFNGGSLVYDFTILVLHSPFVLGPNIDTICLPNYAESFDYAHCHATGWGKDKFGKEGRFQNVMKQVNLNIVPHSLCEKSLKSTRLGQYFELHDSFLCAGGEAEVDTCKGDGGSPLACVKPGSLGKDDIYYQAGIVAWGIGCGEDGIPGVYADVTRAVKWINEAIGPYLRV